MKIIKYTKKNKNTYEITLENKEIITIYDELILKYDLLITKESGVAGGFLEKINACKVLNIPVIIISRKKIDYPKVINNIEDIEKII